MSEPHHLVVGAPEHGVVRYAELLLSAAEVAGTEVLRLSRRVGADDLPTLLAGLDDLDGHVGHAAVDPTAAEVPVRVHLHVTDHLLGGSPEEALLVVRGLARRGPLSLTLHDLPQPSDGAPATRRRDCYAGLVDAAVGVVVSSDHEAALLRAVTGGAGDPAGTPVRVVPLAVPATRPRPVATHAVDPSRPAGRHAPREVAVLGWVYPGKGHAEVLAALDGLPADVGLRVVGGASPGHDDLLDALAAAALAVGRPLRVDGWVPDDSLPDLLHQVDVPVFAPRHVSASASLTTWLAAGRRPVATRSVYTEEVDRRAPGTLLLVDDEPDALADGIRRALADPGLTRLGAALVVGLDPAEAARLTFAGWQP